MKTTKELFELKKIEANKIKDNLSKLFHNLSGYFKGDINRAGLPKIELLRHGGGEEIDDDNWNVPIITLSVDDSLFVEFCCNKETPEDIEGYAYWIKYYSGDFYEPPSEEPMYFNDSRPIPLYNIPNFIFGEWMKNLQKIIIEQVEEMEEYWKIKQEEAEA